MSRAPFCVPRERTPRRKQSTERLNAKMANIFDLFKKIEKKEESSPTPITHIVAGLGNPGDKYFNTRHNAGFLAMDYISQKANVRIDRSKFHALCAEAQIGTHRVLLLKPQTFMNHSGDAVREAAAFYKIPTERVIVLSDDVAQAPGKVRVRKKGSAGGQRGLLSIIEQLGTEEFPRIRLGVGAKPHPDYDLADWVLSEFSKEEQEALFAAFGCVWEGLLHLLDGDVDGAQQICNSHKPPEKKEG